VAAGLCAFSLGSDTMGSVRVPAAYCGVHGIKPGFGAVSTRGSVVLSRRLDHIGPLARSCRDLELILPLMLGFDAAQADSIDYPLDHSDIDLTALKLAAAYGLEQTGVESDVLSVFAGAIAHFASAGAELSSRSIADYDFSAARRAGLLLCEADMLVEQQAWIEEQVSAYPKDLLKLLEWVRGKTAVDIMRAETVVDRAVLKQRELMDGCDFLLLPTTPQGAFAFGDPVPSGQADLTALANMSGYPALSVPMGFSAKGMPLGLQIVGRPGSELQLLKVGQWFSGKLSNHCGDVPKGIA